MSAAPAQHPSPPDGSGQDDEGWALLDGLRRRMDDHAAQTRKTQAQVTQLAESIASLVAVQRKRVRWLNINSFAAYLIFTVLCGGAFYFLYQSRSRELVRAADEAVRRADEAVRRADKAESALAAHDAVKQTHEAEQVKLADTSPADPALDAARTAFKGGKFAEVAPPLEKALAKDPKDPHSAELHYWAGVGRSKTGDVDAAIAHLQAAVALDVAEEDARFQLASAEDRAGQWAKARSDYEQFAAAHPQSQLVAFASRRSATLAKMPAAAPYASPPPKSPPSPAPSPPVSPSP